jgi:hypothetical protein
MTPTPPPAPAEEAILKAVHDAVCDIKAKIAVRLSSEEEAERHFAKVQIDADVERMMKAITPFLRPPAHGEHQGKRETTGTQAINYLLSENACGLPDNTCELLTALHDEFYGKGPAHADAFRILPKVVAFIEKHGLAQCPAEFNRDAIQDTFDETHMWTLHQEGGTGPDRSPGELAQAWAYDYIMQCEKRIAAQSARLAEVERERDDLAGWKQSAMAVEDQWDAQAIATLLGARPGQSCRKVINEAVPRLMARALAAEQKLKEVEDMLTSLKHTVVATIGGKVEGQPTHEGNYLQRLRELLSAEILAGAALAANNDLRAQLQQAQVDRDALKAMFEANPSASWSQLESVCAERDDLNSRLTTILAALPEVTGAIEEAASQKITREMDDDERHDADWETAHDMLVEAARITLAKLHSLTTPANSP